MDDSRSTRPRPTPPKSSGQLGTLGAAAVVATAFLVAFIPALSVPALGLRAGAAIAATISIIAGLVVPKRAFAGIALALVPTSLAVSSQLVPLDGRYLPMAAVAGTLIIGVVRLARQGQMHAKVPPTPVAMTLGAYLVWAAIASLVSIDRATSLIYIGGAAGAFVLAFVLVPTAIGEDGWTRRLLGTVAATALALVVMDIVLVMVGPILLFDQHVGLYEIAEILIAGAPTTLLVPRAMGPFPVAADVGLAMAIGLVALLALRNGATRRAKWLTDASILLVAGGLFLTMARSGWLVAALAVGVYAVIVLIQGRFDRAAFVVAAACGAAFILLSVNVLGARLRQDVAVGRYGPAVAAAIPSAASQGTGSEQFRGGTDLTGRPILWSASLKAIGARPILGWGLGMDPQAIEPYLTGSAAFRGLTSHNTWLRTAVELGLPGALALVAFVGAAVAVIFRQRRALADQRDQAGPAFVAIATGIIAWQAVESLTLGGLSYPGFIWILSIGVLVAIPAVARRGERSEARDLVD